MVEEQTEVLAEPVYVAKLERTFLIEGERRQQIFGFYGFPGLHCVTVCERDSETGQWRALRQTYHVGPSKFVNLDAAIKVWRAEALDRTVMENLGEALRRLVRGLVRPLWHDLSPEQKSSWLSTAGVLVRLLRSFGLRIVPVEEEHHG